MAISPRSTSMIVATVGVVLVTALLASCGASREKVDGVGSTPARTEALPKGSSVHELTVDGTLRSYRTYVPASVDPESPVSLVVMLHGGFGSASQAEQAYGWDAKADAEGFVLLFPDGMSRAWNAGTCCGKPATQEIDDVGFISQAVAAVEKQQRVDPRRVYATGMSNGAMMTYRLACETTIFAAVAPVAGAQMVPCKDPAPVSLLHIHGLADESVPMDGSPGNGLGKVPRHPAIPTAVDEWRSVDGCAAPTTTRAGKVTTTTATCPRGRAVTLITIDGAGHQWPGSVKKRPGLARVLGMDEPSRDLDATSTIWDFFAAHPAPA